MQILFNLAFSQFYLYNLDNGARCTETSVSFTYISCFNNNNNNNNNNYYYYYYYYYYYNDDDDDDVIMDVYGGWYRDLKVKRKKLVRSKSKGVLHNMQKPFFFSF